MSTHGYEYFRLQRVINRQESDKHLKLPHHYSIYTSSCLCYCRIAGEMRGTELLEQLIVFEVTFNIDESISYLISSIFIPKT